MGKGVCGRGRNPLNLKTRHLPPPDRHHKPPSHIHPSHPLSTASRSTSPTTCWASPTSPPSGPAPPWASTPSTRASPRASRGTGRCSPRTGPSTSAKVGAGRVRSGAWSHGSPPPSPHVPGHAPSYLLFIPSIPTNTNIINIDSGAQQGPAPHRGGLPVLHLPAPLPCLPQPPLPVRASSFFFSFLFILGACRNPKIRRPRSPHLFSLSSTTRTPFFPLITHTQQCAYA